MRTIVVLFCVSLLGLLAVPAEAKADDLFVSPGVKAAWTFGHGLTWGFEISLVWAPEDPLKQPAAFGMVFNVDSDFDEVWKMRLGGQVTGPWIGLETGPSLVSDAKGTWFGWGFTPWISSYLIPFYTYTLVFGDTDNLHELGIYLKLHINADADADDESFAGSDIFDD